jgi:hypothetical protein
MLMLHDAWIDIVIGVFQNQNLIACCHKYSSIWEGTLLLIHSGPCLCAIVGVTRRLVAIGFLFVGMGALDESRLVFVAPGSSRSLVAPATWRPPSGSR